MICNCASFERVEMDCPGAHVTFPIISDETGIWYMSVEFDNKNCNTHAVPVNAGMPVTVPNIFNEYYIHLVKFSRLDGSPVNNVCYWLGKFSQPVTPCDYLLTERENYIITESGNNVITERQN